MKDPVDERGVGDEERRKAAEASDPNGLIGSKLKALYRALEQEPVPDLFIDLLQKLDEAESLSRPEDKVRRKP